MQEEKKTKKNSRTTAKLDSLPSPFTPLLSSPLLSLFLPFFFTQATLLASKRPAPTRVIQTSKETNLLQPKTYNPCTLTWSILCMHKPKPESNSLIIMNACDKEKQASKLSALSSKHVENEKVGCFKHASRHTEKYPLHAKTCLEWPTNKHADFWAQLHLWRSSPYKHEPSAERFHDKLSFSPWKQKEKSWQTKEDLPPFTLFNNRNDFYFSFTT